MYFGVLIEWTQEALEFWTIHSTPYELYLNFTAREEKETHKYIEWKILRSLKFLAHLMCDEREMANKKERDKKWFKEIICKI